MYSANCAAETWTIPKAIKEKVRSTQREYGTDSEWIQQHQAASLSGHH